MQQIRKCKHSETTVVRSLIFVMTKSAKLTKEETELDLTHVAPSSPARNIFYCDKYLASYARDERAGTAQSV
jgi:hypothetical protein